MVHWAHSIHTHTNTQNGIILAQTERTVIMSKFYRIFYGRNENFGCPMKKKKRKNSTESNCIVYIVCVSIRQWRRTPSQCRWWWWFFSLYLSLTSHFQILNTSAIYVLYCWNSNKTMLRFIYSVILKMHTFSERNNTLTNLIIVWSWIKSKFGKRHRFELNSNERRKFDGF